eukprot:COSAG02_NODE_112_length_35994_cov_12.152695_16_plen_186_part_00
MPLAGHDGKAERSGGVHGQSQPPTQPSASLDVATTAVDVLETPRAEKLAWKTKDCTAGKYWIVVRKTHAALVPPRHAAPIASKVPILVVPLVVVGVPIICSGSSPSRAALPPYTYWTPSHRKETPPPCSRPHAVLRLLSSSSAAVYQKVFLSTETRTAPPVRTHAPAACAAAPVWLSAPVATAAL